MSGPGLSSSTVGSFVPERMTAIEARFGLGDSPSPSSPDGGAFDAVLAQHGADAGAGGTNRSTTTGLPLSGGQFPGPLRQHVQPESADAERLDQVARFVSDTQHGLSEGEGRQQFAREEKLAAAALLSNETEVGVAQHFGIGLLTLQREQEHVFGLESLDQAG